MKKVLSVGMVFLIVLSLAACGSEPSNVYEIPDVFGVDYTQATTILEAEGFEVRAIAAGVGNFSDKLLYPLEKVEKGTVFKIDEYILDNNGNLNKNYDVFYDEGLVSKDKSIVIYYAEDDYVLVKDTSSDSEETVPDTGTAPTENISEDPMPTESEPEETVPTENDPSNELRPDFLEAMNSYEAFMDEYVAFMKKYLENPADIRLLSDYAKFMQEYAEFVEDFEKWSDEDLNAAELAYYLEVQNRVTQKLLEISQ